MIMPSAFSRTKTTTTGGIPSQQPSEKIISPTDQKRSMPPDTTIPEHAPDTPTDPAQDQSNADDRKGWKNKNEMPQRKWPKSNQISSFSPKNLNFVQNRLQSFLLPEIIQISKNLNFRFRFRTAISQPWRNECRRLWAEFVKKGNKSNNADGLYRSQIFL